jgi:hypothetical protein
MTYLDPGNWAHSSFKEPLGHSIRIPTIMLLRKKIHASGAIAPLADRQRSRSWA